MAKKKEKKDTSAERLERAHQSVIRAFDDAVDPKNLSRQEYIGFTGALIDDLQSRLETAIQEDEAAPDEGV